MLNVTIVSDRRQYEFVSSQQYATRMEVTIRRDAREEGVFFVPVEDRTTRISVTDSKGTQLAQLPPAVLEEKFGITPEEAADAGGSERRFSRVPVLLPPSESEFETLNVEFTSPIDPKLFSRRRLRTSMSVDFDLMISPKEFAIPSPKYAVANEKCDVHITLRAGSDYKIGGDYELSVSPPGGEVITRTAKETPNLVRLHVSGMDFGSDILGRFRVSVVGSITNAAAVITAAAMAIPLVIIMGQALAGRLLDSTLEILGGTIAVLVGSRVWVVQDKYLMRRWVRWHNAAIAVNAFMFAAWFAVWMWLYDPCSDCGAWVG